MSKILELREKRAQKWEAAKAFLDAKRGADGLVPPEAAAEYDKMEADIVALGKDVDRLERQAAFDLELSQPTGTPITNAPAKPEGTDTKKGRASDDYKRAFWDAMRGKGDMASIRNSLKEGTDPDGGYLVPEEFERRLIQALEEENIFRRLATVITASYDRKIPIVASRGTASWVDEEGLIPEGDDQFGQLSLSAYKLATMMKVSEELMSDSAFNMDAFIADSFARRIGDKEQEAFLVGDGTGKPTGIFAATGGGQVGVTTASATAITLDEVIDLYYSLKSPYRAKAAFIMNDQTVKLIRKLKDTNGQYLWQPSVREGTPDTLLSRPLYTSQYVPSAAVGAKTMAFGDFSYYWIADRQGRVFKRLNELYAATGQVGFLATQRVDGKLTLPEAVKILQQKSA